MFKIKIDNKEIEVKDDVTYYELAKKYEMEHNKKPYLVKASGEVKELRRNAKDNENIEFLFYDDNVVKSAYARTATMMLLKVIRDVYGTNVDAGIKFRIHNVYYFEIADIDVTEEKIVKINEIFDNLVKKAVLTKKVTKPKKEALKILEDEKLYDVSFLFKFNYRPQINLRYIDDYVRYINGQLLYDTSYIEYYKIEKFNKGIALILSATDDAKEVVNYGVSKKVFNVLNDSFDWAKKLELNTVGKLNKHISDDTFDDLVIMAESFQNKQIGDIAEKIKESKKKLVFIAGPSSSGKTSFSHRLMYQLLALDLKPHPIACDNFFKNRIDTPKDDKGDYNYEILEAMDTELLNDVLSDLMSGKEVKMPTYNFARGKKEYIGNTLKIEDNDVVILEGIHCLNPMLVPHLNQSDIFKIYVSAFIEVCIDNANRIATSDLRLMRRIVRDCRERNTSAKKTIQMWESVRNGEKISIFPYQENADVLFNSALIYEFSVLKNKALAKLYDLSEDEEVGDTARRLIKILNYFLGVESDAIPSYSLIREFIGGSILCI